MKILVILVRLKTDQQKLKNHQPGPSKQKIDTVTIYESQRLHLER